MEAVASAHRAGHQLSSPLPIPADGARQASTTSAPPGVVESELPCGDRVRIGGGGGGGRPWQPCGSRRGGECRDQDRHGCSRSPKSGERGPRLRVSEPRIPWAMFAPPARATLQPRLRSFRRKPSSSRVATSRHDDLPSMLAHRFWGELAGSRHSAGRDPRECRRLRHLHHRPRRAGHELERGRPPPPRLGRGRGAGLGAAGEAATGFRLSAGGIARPPPHRTARRRR